MGQPQKNITPAGTIAVRGTAQADRSRERSRQAEYGEKDLEERGGAQGEKGIDAAKLHECIEWLNQRLHERQQPKKDTQAARKALKKLKADCLTRLEKYEQ